MKRLLLVPNQTKPEAIALARDAADWLNGQAEVTLIEDGPESDLSQHEADCAVVFGGDGTVLNVIHRLDMNQMPLLTVNLGRLGYLAEISPDALHSSLSKVLADQTRTSTRMMLHATVTEGEKEIWHGHAVNEFVIAPSVPGRLIRIDVEVDGTPLTRFGGDGLIVASPTGSTAYALSAGGPIVSAELRAMVLVPICPHHLSNRPLLLGETEVLRVRHLGSGATRFASDAREPICLNPDSYAEIKASKRRFHLILNEDYGRYDILRNKLGWGGNGPTS